MKGGNIMCKYCEQTSVNVNNGERTNELPTIGKLDLGCFKVELMLNRYDADKDHNHELIIGAYAEIEHGTSGMGTTTIDIKYCPFCGEKL
jgi:hypothetical protein